MNRSDSVDLRKVSTRSREKNLLVCNKAVWYSLHRPGSRQVAILAVKHYTTMS